MSDLQRVGPVFGGTGTAPPFTASLSGSQRINDAHPRFMDANLRGALYSGGMALTSINNVTFTSATLGATCTPIAGIWNPSTSPVNCVIIGANLGVTVTAATATGAGPYVWATSIGNNVITTGSIPLNRKTLALAGSYAKHFPGVALTGLTNNLVVAGAAAVSGGQLQGFSFVATAAGSPAPLPPSNFDPVDGSWIVPPGGVFALLATTTPVAHSAVSTLVWEEVPILP